MRVPPVLIGICGAVGYRHLNLGGGSRGNFGLRRFNFLLFWASSA
jgi:hypothetical protein